MFNLEKFIKELCIDLYNKKVYIGARVREFALNYMLKGYISQDTLMKIDAYITNAETPVEEETIDDIIDEVMESTTEEIIEETVESEAEPEINEPTLVEPTQAEE